MGAAAVPSRKRVNDELGSHGAGELAVKSYFRAVTMALQGSAAAYGIAGDEVVIILPGTTLDDASVTVKAICKIVMKEKLYYRDKQLPVTSVAAGLVCTSDPIMDWQDFKDQADEQMYRAKEAAHSADPNPSAIAIAGKEVLKISHDLKESVHSVTSS